MSRLPQQDPLFTLLSPKRVEYCLPFILGIFLDSFFLGVLWVTFGAWLKAVRPTDRRVVRYLVLYLMAISTIASGMMIAQWVRVYILGFGDFLALTNTTILRSVPTFFVLTRVPAAFFFAMRAYNVLQRPKWLPAVLAPLFLACLTSGFIGTALFTRIPARKLVLNCILIYSASEVASDLVITGSIFYGLYKSKTGWAPTDQIIGRLMKLSIETQTPPALLAVGFLMTSLVKGDGTALGYWVFLPKVYVLCMMLGVNSRVQVAKELNSTANSSGPYRGIEWRPTIPQRLDGATLTDQPIVFPGSPRGTGITGQKRFSGMRSAPVTAL